MCPPQGGHMSGARDAVVDGGVARCEKARTTTTKHQRKHQPSAKQGKAQHSSSSKRQIAQCPN